jgi:hypothetical protein
MAASTISFARGTYLSRDDKKSEFPTLHLRRPTVQQIMPRQPLDFPISPSDSRHRLRENLGITDIKGRLAKTFDGRQCLA